MAEDDSALEAAYKNLSEAISRVSALVDQAGKPLMVTEWVVLTATTRFNSDGDQVSGIRWIVEEPAMSWHRLIGLVRGTSLLLETRFMEPDPEDD